MVCHSSLDWIVALQTSECHSRLLVEQKETVKVLNEKFSSFFCFVNLCVGTETLETSNFMRSGITGSSLQFLY